MSVIVPNIPYKAQFLNPDGFLSQAWVGWFEQMAKRIGGPDALTNLELEDIRVEDIAALTVTVTALQAQVTALQTQVTTGFNDLNQGQRL